MAAVRIREMLIDDFMPVWDFSEKHETIVRAPMASVVKALNEVDFSESFIVRWLLRLRGMSGERVTLDSLKGSRFEILAERDDEMVIGLAGQFWRPTGNLQKVDAATFMQFDQPGFAKAVWNFSIDETHETHETRETPGPSGTSGPLKRGETILGTETRIHCTDDASRSKFGFYWTFIQPFSGWIRNEMLAVVKRKAEGR
jgi:hypothetical protein